MKQVIVIDVLLGSMQVDQQQHFVHDQSMDVGSQTDAKASRVAAAIGEPARARMLYCLMDDRARTSTELAMLADVSPSTASVHLNRLRSEHLVKVHTQGKHHYYSLEGPHVASLLERLSIVAGDSGDKFVSTAPSRLRAARTCYDHMAGTVSVLLHDRLHTLGWLSGISPGGDNAYDLTLKGTKGFEALGINVEATRMLRRRFACACLDWSERRAHIGGALGSALLTIALKRRWVTQDLDSRALAITTSGRREMLTRFGLRV